MREWENRAGKLIIAFHYCVSVYLIVRGTPQSTAHDDDDSRYEISPSHKLQLLLKCISIPYFIYFCIKKTFRIWMHSLFDQIVWNGFLENWHWNWIGKKKFPSIGISLSISLSHSRRSIVSFLKFSIPISVSSFI